MKKYADFVSALLIPLLIPVYLCCIIIGYFPVLLNGVNGNEKWLLVGGIFLFTVVLPFVLVFALFKLKVISSLSLVKREDRYIPQAFSCISYLGVSAYFIFRLGIDNVFSLSMLANTISVTAITLITRHWKISTHAAGAMGFLTILVMLYVKHPVDAFLIPLLVISFLCISVCYARKYLNAHTTAQIIAGGLLGMVIGVSVFSFLK